MATSKRSEQRPQSHKPVTAALSSQQQLQRLRDWHKAIVDRPSPSMGTSPERFVDQWDALEAADDTVRAHATFLLRDATHAGKPPLSQLFDYVEAGFYPPPELLLTLLDVWRTYLLAEGELSLEGAFFGKTVQRAGNHAARAAKERKNLGIAFALGDLQGQGKTKTEAVTELVEKYGLSEDSTKRIKAKP